MLPTSSVKFKVGNSWVVFLEHGLLLCENEKYCVYICLRVVCRIFRRRRWWWLRHHSQSQEKIDKNEHITCFFEWECWPLCFCSCLTRSSMPCVSLNEIERGLSCSHERDLSLPLSLVYTHVGHERHDFDDIICMCDV